MELKLNSILDLTFSCPSVNAQHAYTDGKKKFILITGVSAAVLELGVKCNCVLILQCFTFNVHSSVQFF